MKNELTVRTEVISVEFACSNYQRIASIPRPEFSSDVIRVKPLWKTLGLSEKHTKDSDIMVYDFSGTYRPGLGYSNGHVNLRWYDSVYAKSTKHYRYQINGKDPVHQKSGFMVRQVEVYYTSVILDRQDKLDTLGV